MDSNPFYAVFIEGNEKREISEYVQSLSYTHSVKKDSTVTIKIYADKVNAFEENDIKRGQYLQIQYGYKKASVSNFYSLRISDIQYRYGGTIEITITATDKGNVMKKGTSKKIWKNVTTGKIITDIAKKYGLQYTNDYDGKNWDNLPQAGENDFEFLQKLAAREKDGNFIIYVSGNTLHFVKRGLDKDSSFLFQYGNPESGIISFVPKETETTLGSQDIKISATVESTIVTPGDSNEVSLGKFKFTYNANGEDVATGLGKSLGLPDKDTEVAENRLKSVKNEGKLKGLKATLTVTGKPTLLPNQIITISGVRLRHVGNYLITEVKHTIDKNGGYKSVLELSKNGNEIGTDTAENVNKSVGTENGEEKKVTLFIYDQDGNEISTSNGSEYKKL